MDIKEIRELASLMREMGLDSVSYNNGAESILLTRPILAAEPESTKENVSSSAAYGKHDGGSPLQGSGFIIKSPMVGVFYSAPGVGEEPYVKIGDDVLQGDVLCVIEAMKIMNEISAEREGVVTEIFVENKQVVEFGQPLFRISSAFALGENANET